MKQNYDAPAATVLEVDISRVICNSPFVLTAILYESSAEEINWGRGSYGTAVTDTWE